jgi:hypothetical protein
MAVVALEVKTRQALACGQDFGDVGRYAQIDGAAHFAVDPTHLLNRCITDIDLARQGGDGLVHFSADIRILTPEDPRRGNHRLLFDVPNRGNRLALATFNRVPRPINPSAPTDPGDGFLMRHGYTVVWCGWQHDVPAAEGLMRIKVPDAQRAGTPVSGRLLVSFQPGATSQVQLLSTGATAPILATISTTRTQLCSCATATMLARGWSRGKSGRSPGWRPGRWFPTATMSTSQRGSSRARSIM